MSIRIRVYPQYGINSSFGSFGSFGSVGPFGATSVRRSRAARKAAALQQRQINLANLQLQRQLGATVPGGNAYGAVYQSGFGLPSAGYGVLGTYAGYSPLQQPGYGAYPGFLGTATSPFAPAYAPQLLAPYGVC